MQITSISLRNYRVFESLDLELPPGLVGIYGPNGAGKSSLLESITWALYGRARTAKGDIRTAGSTGECLVEIGFVHDDDHYLVRRSVSGVNSTVKARVMLGSSVAADGPVEVGKYLRSTIGMDEAAFRSSVFAEQKQLAAFSDFAPDQRRKLILQLLGITPLEKARDAARLDAKGARTTHERLLALLPQLQELAATVESCEVAVDAAKVTGEATAKELAKAYEAENVAAVEGARLQDVHRIYELITAKGRAARSVRDDAQSQCDRLVSALSDVEAAAMEYSALPHQQSETDRVMQASLLSWLTQLEEAHNAMRLLPEADEATEPQRSPVEAALTAWESAREHATETATLTRLAKAAETTCRISLENVDALDGVPECPTCGQTIADGGASVREHRATELAQASALVVSATKAQRAAEAEVAKLGEAKTLAQKQFELAQKQFAAAEQARTRRAVAVERVVGLAERIAALDANTGAVDRLALLIGDRAAVRAASGALSAAIEHERTIDARRSTLQAQLNREPQLRDDLAAAQARLSGAESERQTLRSDLDALRYDPRAWHTQQERLSEIKAAHVAARATDDKTKRTVALAEQRLAAAEAQHKQALKQHEQALELSESARYLSRTAELLHGFRQAIVTTVGPRLSLEASALFNELTAGDYEGLEIDPETYAIRIVDSGIAYPSERFSGSEVDLANLALRVAISEQVRFQAGGRIGLLVLDEALASLDVDRKDRMLGALTQLSARFRQILVVTHASEVKERLPQAIFIAKRPGRRATAAVVDSPAG
jgi:DNA repair protein SbcC/Rad50